MRLIVFVRVLCGLFACHGSLVAGQRLPVFLADNHAETFGWIVRTFDVDKPHVMVLVDAHSDATAVERSEEIREGLRRVPTERARDANVEKWRDQGRIQAYNWIEPLLPRPVDRVCWLAGWELWESGRAEAHREAVTSLDGRLEVEPRSAGSLAGRWTTMTGREFVKWHPGVQPVILAVDLDFFAGMAVDEREQVFERIWSRAMDWPGLAGVAFSVSRPWLTDDGEADALVKLASAAVLRTRGAVMEMDVSVDDRPDDSKKSTESSVPLARWDAMHASIGLKVLWQSMQGRLKCVGRAREAVILPETGGLSVRIRPDRGEVDCDGVWRFRVGERPVFRVESSAGNSGRVKWFVCRPARDAYDLLPETRLGKSFAAAPGRWVYDHLDPLGETADLSLDPERLPISRAGRIRLQAEVETDVGWIPVPPVDVRFADADGFRGALSECFGMPYVFGVGEVVEDEWTGVETGWGSDCANFLIHAWRRNGLALEWGDPGRLRAQLATKVENVSLADDLEVREEEIQQGLAVDFGRHVAAVWKDLEPVGRLGGNDLLVHHLGGFPAIISLSDLAKDRPVFSLRVPSKPEAVCRVKVAGDVVLAGDRRDVLEGFGKGDAGLFVVNLEGVPSARDPEVAPRVDFRFPKERLAWLRDQGVDAVSLANNHAGDAGEGGLIEGIRSLRAKGIAVVGAGENVQAACQPWRVERQGVRLAVFGVCLVDAMTAADDRPGVARLPDHQALFEDAMRRARSAGEQVVVLVHGGDEYKQAVNDDQRRWARWLVDRGARVVAGAHPHVVQRVEWHGGAGIAHSLGNAVYPAGLGKAASGEIRVFEVRQGD